MPRRKRDREGERRKAEALLGQLKKPPRWGRRKRLSLVDRGVVSLRRLVEDVGEGR